MSVLGAIKLSGIQLSVIGFLLLLIILFVMPFGFGKNNQQGLNSENQDQQLKAPIHQGQVKILTPSVNEDIKDETFPGFVQSTHKSAEILIAESQTSTSSSSDFESKNTLTLLDDESLLNISDILESSLVPAFSSGIEALDHRFEQKAAIDVVVSRLPDSLSDSDLHKINSLLRDYLPYDLADTLSQKIEQSYQLHQREQAYLSSALANNKSAETMAEQIVIAMHLENLKGESALQETEFNLEPSETYLDWQKTEEKFKQIQSTSTDPNQDIHEVIKDEYGSEVADDYLELANAETQWAEKYSTFLAEKNIISDAGLSEQDKADQIESLIQQHYQENEWAAARAYDEMMQGRSEE